MQEDAIKRLRVVASDSGIAETTQKVGQLTKAEVDLETAQIRRASAQVQLVNAQNRQMIQYQQMLNVQQQFASANDNIANSTNHISDVLRSSTKAAIDYSASWLATAGAVGAGLLVLGRVLSILAPIILVYKALKDAIDLVREAWDLGGKKLEEYRQIAERAAAVDLSASFFQRITKSATDAKLPVDALTESLKNLEKVTAEKLGGSDFQNRLDALSGAGNFQGNTGVSQLAQANTAEQKFRAIVSLVDQAMAKGERLAALDLTSKFLSPAVQQALTKDSEYLKNMLESADKLSSTQIVSDEDVARALDLQRRYDAAVAILEQRWHPIQDLLTQAGIKMQSAWVGIVEAVANAVDWVAKLVMKIGEIPQTFWDYIKKGATTAAPLIGGAVAGPFGAAAGAAINVGVNTGLIGGSGEAAKTDDYTLAVNKLAAGLKNVNTVQQAVAQTNAVQAAVWKDTSHAVEDAAKTTAVVRDQYDRARDAIEKHTARLVADKDALGLGAGAQEQFRAKAALMTAAIQAGLPITAELVAEMDKLAKAAGDAGQALAMAKANSDAKFNLDTVGLSDVEKQIASINRQLHGDDWKNYTDDALSNTIRLTNGIKDVKDAAQQFTKDFVSGLMQGKTGMESLASAATNLSAKLTDKALTDLFSGNFLQAGIEGIGAAISYFVGKSAQKDADLEKAKKAWSDMKDQVVAFNNAAKGVDFGPITQAVQQLFQTQLTLATAAYKAQDYKGLANIQGTFNQGVTRLINSFINGNPVLSDLEQKMKAVSDEGQGLIQVLQQLGLANATTVAGITDAIVRQQAALQDAQAAADKAAAAAAAADAAAAAADAAAKRQSDTDSLIADVRNNSGVGYLNTITDALKKFNDLAAEGVEPGVLQGWLISTAQTAVNSAQLTGEAFQALITEFPQLTHVVHEFIDTTALAAKAAADATQKLALQLRLLSATTDTSTQAGALTLFDAKAKQERDAAIAGGISPDNLLLLDQALAAERLGVIKGFTDQAVAAEKQLADARLAQMQRIQQYLDGLTAGSGSTLAPSDRLAAASSQYSTQLGLAKSGDATALGNITTYSQNVLEAARAYYGSTSGYQSIFAQVQQDLSALIGLAGAGAGASATSSAISGAASSIGGVSSISSTPAAANTNSWASVVDAVNSMKAEIVVLKTTLKAAVDTNTQAVGVAHEEEKAELQSIDDSLKFLKTAGKLV
jgi:hypothetical protein